jgi:hypothetical protein
VHESKIDLRLAGHFRLCFFDYILYEFLKKFAPSWTGGLSDLNFAGILGP